MSNILSGIGKIFKKIVQSPVFKVVAIAAAIYFTGGIAAASMGVSGAASLPGISTAMGFLGIEAPLIAEAGTIALEAAVPIEAASYLESGVVPGLEGAGGTASFVDMTAGGAISEAPGLVNEASGTFTHPYGASPADSLGEMAPTSDASWLQQPLSGQDGIVNAEIIEDPSTINPLDPSQNPGGPEYGASPAPETPPPEYGTGPVGGGLENPALAQEGMFNPLKDAIGKVKEFYGGLDPHGKRAVWQGLSLGAQSILKSIGTQSQLDQQRREFDFYKTTRQFNPQQSPYANGVAPRPPVGGIVNQFAAAPRGA